MSIALRARRRGAALMIVLTAMLLPAILPAAALADADPASDTLVVQDAFYPYTPSTPAALQHDLTRALAEIHATGLKLKVAIIGSAVDLGGIPELFGQVDRYARFLDTEISFHGPQPLLVVMPDGVAVANTGSASALDGLAVDAHHGAAGLVRTAVAAVERIAAARGHAIAPVATGTTGGASGSGGAVIGGAAAVVLLALLGAAATVRSRSKRRRGSEPGREDVGAVGRDVTRQLEHDPGVPA